MRKAIAAVIVVAASIAVVSFAKDVWGSWKVAHKKKVPKLESKADSLLYDEEQTFAFV